MKIKKGFSLADILITITVVGIIAGVSLGFFKQQEPDKRIYDSTVRQLSRIVGAISYKACSDDLMCWISDEIITPTCPPYGGAVVNFSNNRCSFAPTEPAGAECSADDPPVGGVGSYQLQNGQCTANPQCAGGVDPVSYSSVFCPNFVPDLGIPVVDSGGNQMTFFCFQVFDMLHVMNNVNKATICTSTEPVTLPNRARLFGLGNMGTGMRRVGAASTPGVILIKYDSSTNPLYGNNESDSMSDSTTGYVVIFPNGKMVTKEVIEAHNGGNTALSMDNLKSLNFQGQESNVAFNTGEKSIVSSITAICGDDGAGCHIDDPNIIDFGSEPN